MDVPTGVRNFSIGLIILWAIYFLGAFLGTKEGASSGSENTLFFNFTFISQPWSFIFRKLGLGDHLVSRQHRRLRRSHLWDDEDQEDLPPPRALCQRLRRHCRHSQRHPQLHSLELVCVSDFEFHLFHYIYMKMLWSRCEQNFCYILVLFWFNFNLPYKGIITLQKDSACIAIAISPSPSNWFCCSAIWLIGIAALTAYYAIGLKNVYDDMSDAPPAGLSTSSSLRYRSWSWSWSSLTYWSCSWFNHLLGCLNEIFSW